MILIFALKNEVEHSLFLKVLRPFHELEKYSSGHAGHLPWIVKLPRLKIGWGAKNCISPVLLTFLIRRICCEFLYFALVFITLPVTLECLTKAPLILYLPSQQFKRERKRDEEKWMNMSVEVINPFPVSTGILVFHTFPLGIRSSAKDWLASSEERFLKR